MATNAFQESGSPRCAALRVDGALGNPVTLREATRVVMNHLGKSAALQAKIFATLSLLLSTGCLVRPPSVVDVYVKHVPPATVDVDVVADAAGKWLPLDFAVYMFLWDGMPARDHHFGGLVQTDPSIYQTRVFWIGGGRMGVVTASASAGWTVHWFGLAKIKRLGCSPITGGAWYCDLDNADSVHALSRDQVREFFTNK